MWVGTHNSLGQIQRICVLGLEEIGLPLAASLALRGFTVIGVGTLNGITYPEDLHKVIEEAFSTGRLRVSSQVELADLFILTQPHEGSLRKTLQKLVPHLGRRTPIILCSVRPRGLLYHAAQRILERAGLEAEKDFYLLCHTGPALLKRSLATHQAPSQPALRSYYYRRPYQDRWGNWHYPITEWDELLKYYKHWVVLLVSEATRRMAQPASIRAHALLVQEQRSRRRHFQKVAQLEAQYLEREDARKRHKRAQKQANLVSAS
ncbi:MAG: hypothetical protein ABIN58_00410 [candidate division WOR-3 bacterium]